MNISTHFGILFNKVQKCNEKLTYPKRLRHRIKIKRTNMKIAKVCSFDFNSVNNYVFKLLDTLSVHKDFIITSSLASCEAIFPDMWTFHYICTSLKKIQWMETKVQNKEDVILSRIFGNFIFVRSYALSSVFDSH